MTWYFIFLHSGPVAILILINKEDFYIDSNGIRTIYKSPIVRLKDLIGNKDPVVAKANNPYSLRGLYGQDLIKNEICNYIITIIKRYNKKKITLRHNNW